MKIQNPIELIEDAYQEVKKSAEDTERGEDRITVSLSAMKNLGAIIDTEKKKFTDKKSGGSTTDILKDSQNR
jgi:hypothetical protein